MNTMKWSNERPTEPGYYWAQRPGELARIILIEVHFRTVCAVKWVRHGARLFPLNSGEYDGLRWAGPLDPPEV
jgi:hypothetical protein